MCGLPKKPHPQAKWPERQRSKPEEVFLPQVEKDAPPARNLAKEEVSETQAKQAKGRRANPRILLTWMTILLSWMLLARDYSGGKATTEFDAQNASTIGYTLNYAEESASIARSSSPKQIAQMVARKTNR